MGRPAAAAGSMAVVFLVTGIAWSTGCMHGSDETAGARRRGWDGVSVEEDIRIGAGYGVRGLCAVRLVRRVGPSWIDARRGSDELWGGDGRAWAGLGCST